MLQITIPAAEYYDDDKGEFINIPSQTLMLEHSLLSISKWEAKWKKPFLVENPPKTEEETMDYIRCMTINHRSIDARCYMGITSAQLTEIMNYINDPMTATTFSNHRQSQNGRKKQVITSELLYYDMTACNIPFECEKWHLNRLLTLINICAIKNQPPKKMKKSDISKRNRALNAKRRAAYNTSG